MAAFGIEELGNDTYKVIRFRYRWQMTQWVAKKPDKRRPAETSTLDIHLKVKARRTGTVILRDTRR